MISSRSAYSGEVDYFRRSQRGLSLAIGQNSSISDHCTSSHSSRRQSPVTDNDSKPSASQRKRVPVACERCRKRKIKCSGDEGGGQGCVNCRNAGWDGCQFLRVQSFNTHVNDAAIVGSHAWPINRYNPYSYNGHRFNTQAHIQPPYHSSLPPYTGWTNAEFGNYSNTGQVTAWQRPSYGGQYPFTYPNEATSSYTVQTPPSYMLPDPELTPHLSMAYTNTLHRPQQNVIWLDQATNVPLTQQHECATNSYGIMPEGQAHHVTISPSTHGVAVPERLLSSTTNVGCLPSVSAATNNTPPLSAASHRSSVGWHTDTASNASTNSSHTSCHTHQEPALSTASADFEHQELSYSYNDTPGLARSPDTPALLSGELGDQHFSSTTLTSSPPQRVRHHGSGAYNRSPESTSSSRSYGYRNSCMKVRKSAQKTQSRQQPRNRSDLWSTTRTSKRQNTGETSAVKDYRHSQQSPIMSLINRQQY